MANIKICVIGAGKWGKNHVKTLSQLDSLGGILDIDKKQLRNFKELFPNINLIHSIDDALKKDFDGYIIATPPSTHYELAKKILFKKKPVLVEKPLATSVKQGLKIRSIINELNGRLVVGHLLLFHPAIIKMKKIIEEGVIGEIKYLYSNRLNMGVVRDDENVFWSLAPHDIALFQFFINSFPTKVKNEGTAFINKKINDISLCKIRYNNNVSGHIFASWFHPFKEHRFIIIGSKGILHFEDAKDKKPLLLYKNDSLNKKTPPSIVKYGYELPLTNELKHFIKIIKGESISKGNIDEAIDVLKILEMGTKYT